MMRSIMLIAALARTSLASTGPYDGWAPHRYCNSMDGIEATRIPQLTSQQVKRVESLEQVQIIARHGARVPYAKLFCWDSNIHNPMGAQWNCTTTSVSSHDINLNENTAGFGRLYRKSYMKGHNILNGDCIVGGLLPLGRLQHKSNGEFLCDSYVGDGPLKLFPTANLSHLELSKIYLRSDDQERTLGSGQALIDGLFPVDSTRSFEMQRMLSWDVSDIAMDYISPNENICPYIGHISELSSKSVEMEKHLQDTATVKIDKHFSNIVGEFSWSTVLECLSTARCNNLELPSGIDEETFAKTYHEVEVRQGYYLLYNNSWYAKLAMQPLAHDMIRRLDDALTGNPDAFKLSVTMAHDSTIMPLLAASLKENWDRLWTPYAGMLVIEMYKMKSGSHAVRMIFHGEVQQIPECDDTLCDIAEFFEAFAFARNPRTELDCQLPKKKDKSRIYSSNLIITMSGDDAGAGASYYVGGYLLLGLVGGSALLALRAKARSYQQRGDGEFASLIT
ncbi:hypothetical protein CCR75_000730 [Bremia lactucae]|uniref:Acid phosphatase n=1 Tax=Bremia lactucae TaxID=4779 RepID=A0A976FI79_BRELC|nr:hypothetical protein CCR75_000730 [Bremia lactucae]